MKTRPFLDGTVRLKPMVGHLKAACTTKLLALLLLLALPAGLQAQDYTYITNKGRITITGYIGPGGAVTIPTTINGLAVTIVGDSTFGFNTSLTSVIIPNTVTNIGNHAFYRCTSLANVTIGGSVTTIGTSAFYRCTSLSSVVIPDSVTSIGSDAFYRCSSLTNVTIGSNVKSIGGSAFYSCSSLANVTIPSTVTNIGSSAFYSCTSLTGITVDAFNSFYGSVDGVLFNKSQTTLIQCPGGKAGSYAITNTVTSIGSSAFYNCTSLTNITIPNSVTNIGSSALASCTSLTGITVDPLNSFYSSVAGVLFNLSQTTLIQCPGAEVGSYIVPNGVTNIGSSAFYNCDSLTSVTIPNSVTNIGSSAFYSCSSLTSVTVPGSVTNIGGSAFASCTSLTGITVDALNAFYSSVDGILFNKNQTTLIQCPGGRAGSYTIPNSVTNIGSSAFYHCASLTGVTIPNSVISIGSDAFNSCSSLTSITIPNSVTSIGSSAFNSCSNLASITIPNSVTSIGSDAFQYCSSLTSVTIPNSITSIGDYAFTYCTSLAGVYFQGNAPGVGLAVFGGDYNTTVYYLPGAAGWSTTAFGGRPTVLWNPQVQTGDASFGVHTNQFGFTITGNSNLVIVVVACTNLTNPAWSPLQINTLTGGSSYFSDPQWTNFGVRFYRFRSP